MSFAIMRANSVRKIQKLPEKVEEKKEPEKPGEKPFAPAAGTPEAAAAATKAAAAAAAAAPAPPKVDVPALVRRFQIVAGVKINKDETVPEVAKHFRQHKTREFWIYIFFVVTFSASTLQQRPVEKTHDFIKQSMDGTVLGSSLPSVSFEKTLDDVGSIGDFWDWITEAPPQYLYQYKWYNGTDFTPDFQGTMWRVASDRAFPAWRLCDVAL
eukprot:3849151-Rhodomonas_salina.1